MREKRRDREERREEEREEGKRERKKEGEAVRINQSDMDVCVYVLACLCAYTCC